MKLKKLTLKNIASIEDAEICFDEAPLKHEPVFLICGETGSGKTTILDGICLALYNETPRMNKTGTKKYTEANGNKQDIEISVNDKRQLMRRNTAEAWCILEFTGADEHDYCAQWYVSKARKQVHGNLQQVKWSLEDRTLQYTWNKNIDIKQQINKAVGLTFEQYCRTALLAQGDFTQFLHSGETEKSEILEKLTGTDIYSKIGSQIFANLREKKNNYERLQQRMEDIHLLSDEEVREIHSSIEQENRSRSSFEKQYNVTKQKYEWIQKYESLNIQKENVENLFNSSNSMLQSSDFKEKEANIALWNDTEEIRATLKQQENVSEILEQCHRDQHLLKEQFKQGNNELAMAYSELTETEKQLQIKEQDFLLKKKLAPMFDRCQEITNKLKHIDSFIKRIQTKKETQQEIVQKIPCENSILEKTKESNNILKKEQSQLQETIDSIRKNLDNNELTKLQNKQKDLSEMLIDLNKAKSVIQLLKEKYNNKKELSAEQNELKQILETTQKQIVEQSKVVAQKENSYKQTDELVKKQKWAISDWARELRNQLQIDDVCPVCGKRIEENLKEEDFNSLLQPLLLNLEKQKGEYEEENKILIELQAKFSTNKAAYQDKEIRLQKLNEAYRASYNETMEACLKCGITQMVSTTQQDVDKRIKELETQQENINNQVEAIQKNIKLLNNKQELKDKNQEEIDKNQNLITEKEKLISQLQVNQEECLNSISTDQKEIEMIEEEIRPLILFDNAEELWNQRRQDLVALLEKETKLYHELTEEIQKLKQNINLQQVKLNQCNEQKASILKMFGSWKDLETTPQHNCINLTEYWNELTQKATALNERITHNEERLKQTTSNIEVFCNTHPTYSLESIKELNTKSTDFIDTLRKEVEELKNLHLQYKTQLQQICQQQKDHLTEKPELNECDSISNLQQQMEQISQFVANANQNIGRYQASLESNEQNRKKSSHMLKEVETIKAEYAQWNELYVLFGDEKGNKFRNIAQSYVLKELLERANYYLEKLTERYELSCQAGSLTILLKDWYQGGVVRPTSTLSGGESFLISLSLALGLSSLNRQSFSVDTLFIDEGFGTLSSDYLNVVMDTLERLHQLGGKKVGIISHVEELRERIKTQINVQRIDQGRSKIEVTHEN